MAGFEGPDPRDGPPRPGADDLNATLAEVWRILARGAEVPEADARTPTLATTGANGEPEARTVVLRECRREARLLAVHTDARSAKVMDLARDPRCQLHIYEREAGVQFRIACRARLRAGDDRAQTAWAETPEPARFLYRVEPAPGTPIPSPNAAAFPSNDGDDGRANFMVLELHVERIEWLLLHRDGHRRARFAWDRDDWAGQWVAP